MKNTNGTLDGQVNGNGSAKAPRFSPEEFPANIDLARHTESLEPADLDLEITPDLAPEAGHEAKPQEQPAPRRRYFRAVAGAAVLLGLAVGAVYLSSHGVSGLQSLVMGTPAADPAAPVPTVVVSTPLVRDVQPRLQFLGQFSAVEHVEIRAQVGGILQQIGFKDGDVVKQGDLLFTIDPTQYEIKLAQALAQLETAKAHLSLADSELVRAKNLQQTGALSSEELESRASQQLAAQAAMDDAQAAVRDAQFDLDHCRITAPFTGRIGSHLVSVGNLIAGSRAATSPTTLLATIESIDPIYLSFDMSEADYMTFLQARAKQTGPLADKVTISLTGEGNFAREGILDFVDNALDRSSGTIHARATVPNKDLLLTPGGFARVRVELGAAVPALLVPDAAVLNDQSSRVVMTVDADGTVAPKVVELGDLRDGLRVIRSGLAASDRVIIDGVVLAKPGAKVLTSAGKIQEQPDQVAVSNH